MLIHQALLVPTDNQPTQAMFFCFGNYYSGYQILQWGELCKYWDVYKVGYSILLVQLVQAYVEAKAAANPLQIEKDTKAAISWVRVNLFTSSPRTHTCWCGTENRTVIFISLYTIVPRTHILDIVFLSMRSSHQDAIKFLLVLWTLVVARGRGIVCPRGKIWEHYPQNNWAFILFLSLHCFLYQILWKLNNKISFWDSWIPVNPKDGFRLCIPTLPAL